MATHQGTERPTVRERRKALGWSQDALADAADVSRPTIIQIEREELHAHDITAVKTNSSSRRKVVEALDREERQRRERANRLGVEAWNATARAIHNIERLIDQGVMSPGGALLSISSVVDHYAVAIGEVDPVAVEQAAKYENALAKGQIQARAQRN